MSSALDPFTGLESDHDRTYDSLSPVEEMLRGNGVESRCESFYQNQPPVPHVYMPMYQSQLRANRRKEMEAMRKSAPSSMCVAILSTILVILVLLTLSVIVVAIVVLYGVWVRLEKLDSLFQCLGSGGLTNIFEEI